MASTKVKLVCGVTLIEEQSSFDNDSFDNEVSSVADVSGYDDNNSSVGKIFETDETDTGGF